MGLIKCEDCGRDVSDRAAACPNCGGPIDQITARPDEPQNVTAQNDEFFGTKQMVVRLAIKAIQSLNWKVDNADEASGLISFTTGMTWGSWSGVSGSVFVEELGLYRFGVSGRAKQNVRGGQVIALDLFGEADGKVQKVIDEMRRLVS